MFTRRKQNEAVPEVGAQAPEFNLPSAQGGQLRLSMRTVRGPVVVAFYRPGNEDDVGYFKALAEKEQEINLASASVVGIGVAEPSDAREFARATGLKSYLLYDYARITSPQWGVLEGDRRHGYSSRPAVFVVGPDGNVAHAWTAERLAPDELLEKVSAITGLPKKPEEEKPAEADGEKPKKMSAEERERIKAERRAARESGQSVKSPESAQPAGGAEAEGQPKKMSKEERERIKAERQAARESGKSLKSDAPGVPTAGAASAEGSGAAPAEAPAEAPKKMSAEERERIKAERRAAREAGQSLKKPAGEQPSASGDEAAAPAEATEPEAEQ